MLRASLPPRLLPRVALGVGRSRRGVGDALGVRLGAGDALGVDLESQPELLATPRLAALAAGWYWEARGINAQCDSDDVIAVTEEEREAALALVHRLRDHGHAVDYSMRTQSVGKQLRAAAALGPPKAMILGPDERAEGVVVIRELAGGEEVRIPIDRVGEAR